MLVHRRVTPSIKFAGTHLYTWVERGTVRVKCLAQENNIMSPARARTWTARSGDERTNHEATAPPTNPPEGVLIHHKTFSLHSRTTCIPFPLLDALYLSGSLETSFHYKIWKRNMATDLPILFPSFPKRGVAIRYAPVHGRKMTPVKQSSKHSISQLRS